MSSSLDESRSDRFLASSSGASTFWVEDMCICCLVYLFLRLSWFWAFGWPLLACLILAQFIVYAVSAVSWSPVSFHLAWMSAVVAWGLASSSCASNLWIEWYCVVCLGLSSSSLDCLGSVPSSCCCFDSVPCLRCPCRVVDPCRLTASLDGCHSCMLACLHHPALVTLGLSDIQSRLVCLSLPWLALVLGIRFPLFDAVSWLYCLYGGVDSWQFKSILDVSRSCVVLASHHPALIILGWAP